MSITIIILLVVVGGIVLWGFLTDWTFSGLIPREGARCTPGEDEKDENAEEYIYDADKKCLIVNKCKEGWEPDSSNSACISTLSGEECDGADENGTYKYDTNGECVLSIRKKKTDKDKNKDKNKNKNKDKNKNKNKNKPTPKNCKMSEWVLDSMCVKTDTGFNKMYKRFPLENARNGGRKCPPESKWERKGPVCPPEDCEVSQWNRSGNECQPQGDGTFATKWTRQILSEPRYGGKACPALNELRVCPKQDCEWEWRPSSMCEYDNDGGFSTSTSVHVIRQPRYGGKACPRPQNRYTPCIPDDGIECETIVYNPDTKKTTVTEGVTLGGVCNTSG
jgi:hypothetical protein